MYPQHKSRSSKILEVQGLSGQSGVHKESLSERGVGDGSVRWQSVLERSCAVCRGPHGTLGYLMYMFVLASLLIFVSHLK